MSIRHGLLALLSYESMYGYQLRTEFDRATGSTWPLNVGQVYTTLARLERDGLVTAQGEDEQGRLRYAVTGDGIAELEAWFDQPVEQTNRPRDELAIKLALAVAVPGVDVSRVVQSQRSGTLRRLQELTRLKAQQSEPGQIGDRGGAADLSWSLVLESLRFAADAELRWLDHCEASVLRKSSVRRGGKKVSEQPRRSAVVPARRRVAR